MTFLNLYPLQRCFIEYVNDTFIFLDIQCAMSQKEVEQHLEMGKKMLAAGQLADALSHYHAAAGQESYYVLGQNLFCCLSHFNC